MKPPNRPVLDAALEALCRAVERTHGVKAHFVGSVEVHEEFQGATVWKGTVSRFRLDGHPKAAGCYAWSVPAKKGARERFHAVLHTDVVDSAAKAVRASLVAEHTAVK